MGLAPRAKRRGYTKHHLRLLKMADYVATYGAAEERRALSIVLESLLARSGGKPI